jgi:DNA-directed RNA polymerase subunit RPC12/RpoP
MFDGEDGGRKKIKLIVAGVVFLAAAVIAGISMSGETIADIAAQRAFMCTQCGHVYEHVLQMGERDPLECPVCEAMAAYPAEACYWTRGPDGNWKANVRPTFVVLNTRIDPKSEKKTICPDCGREVVGHNPRPPQELMDAARAEAGL